MESVIVKIYINYIRCLLYNNTIINCVDLKILNMSLNIIFTWWNRQTCGTFLKALLYGSYVGKDEFGNKYYKSRNIKKSGTG